MYISASSVQRYLNYPSKICNLKSTKLLGPQRLQKQAQKRLMANYQLGAN